MQKYFEKVYNVITSPTSAFNEIKAAPDFIGGLVSVCIASVFMHLLRFEHSGQSGDLFWCIFSLQFLIIFMLALWFMGGLLYQLVSKVFTDKSSLKLYLSLSGYSYIPLIFMAPASLLKLLGPLGYFLGALAQLSILIWVLYLLVKSIQTAYNLEFSRALLLISIPFLSGILMFLWATQFIAVLFYIFKV